MTETSWPFDGAPMPEDSYRRLFNRFADDGLLADFGSNEAQVYADSSAMRVRRRAAPTGAVVQGFGWLDLNEMLVPIPANASSQPRIDRVVLRLNPAGNAITTVNKTGIAQQTPVAPDLTRDPAGLWEMSLATVRVEAGAGIAGNAVQSIAPEKVLTDERIFSGRTKLRAPTTAQLPLLNVPLWLDAVTADGRQWQWNGTVWTAQPSTVTVVPKMAAGSPYLDIGLTVDHWTWTYLPGGIVHVDGVFTVTTSANGGQALYFPQGFPPVAGPAGTVIAGIYGNGAAYTLVKRSDNVAVLGDAGGNIIPSIGVVAGGVWTVRSTLKSTAA